MEHLLKKIEWDSRPAHIDGKLEHRDNVIRLYVYRTDYKKFQLHDDYSDLKWSFRVEDSLPFGDLMSSDWTDKVLPACKAKLVERITHWIAGGRKL